MQANASPTIACSVWGFVALLQGGVSNDAHEDEVGMTLRRILQV
jgi:hypothetical protein